MPYSILSLDGGGTWALVQVRILQQRYGPDARGHDVLKRYDLVIANSGGSLVLAAMCANKTLEEIAGIFNHEATLKKIFDFKFGMKPLFGFERFSTESKFNGLRSVLGDVSGYELGDLPEFIGKSSPEIVICGFDYDHERAVYFRSNGLSMMESSNIERRNSGFPPDATGRKRITLLEAIHASSNAPLLFFDRPARITYENDNDRIHLFWDGAVGGNNNPVLSGLLEAMSNGQKVSDIRIVSIGTANTWLPVVFENDPKDNCQYEWLQIESKVHNDINEMKKMANAIIADPPDAATFNVNQVMGITTSKSAQLIRINPMMKPRLDADSNWKAPGRNWIERDLKELFTMDMAVTDSDKVALIDRMCDDFFEDRFDNQGVRMGGPGMQPILGHKVFSEALTDWKSWGD